MNIAIIDGQGGGLGKAIIARLRAELMENTNIIALGTNPGAAKAMHKAGANQSFYGESLIVKHILNSNLDCIVAPIGVLCSGGINGEVTYKISHSVVNKECTKYIIPLKKHGFYIPGTTNLELKDILKEIVAEIKKCQESVS
ncbi:DUF3842 family protein [Clostridium swellfunianum]|uniref:DUF3842 family protein n=1 Tax=Clostridium swellfunianum TaxID=1367462 RepID=UPI0020300DB8|nr:DUF3842 family protein [Clostridium swellfunianum]